MADAILEEIRKTRDELAEAFQFNIHELCEALRQEQAIGDNSPGNLPPLGEAIQDRGEHPCETRMLVPTP